MTTKKKNCNFDNICDFGFRPLAAPAKFKSSDYAIN